MFIPLLHVNNIGELPIYIKKYSEDVIKQIVTHRPGRIQFNFDCYAKFAKWWFMVPRDIPAFMMGNQIIDSPNQIPELCDKAVQDIMNFYDNVEIKESKLTYIHLWSCLKYINKNESSDFKKKGKAGKWQQDYGPITNY